MATKVRPFLMFQGNAGEAIDFYVSLFPDGEITDVVRYGPGEAGTEGTIAKASFSIGSQTVLCTDSIVKHAFTFSTRTHLPNVKRKHTRLFGRNQARRHGRHRQSSPLPQGESPRLGIQGSHGQPGEIRPHAP
jgi:uncharacterized glyoxalase superfamily protein PhnB